MAHVIEAALSREYVLDGRTTFRPFCVAFARWHIAVFVIGRVRRHGKVRKDLCITILDSFNLRDLILS